MKLHPITKRFLPLEKGKKTQKMLNVEKRIGRTLEEDYLQYYIKEKWGQKKLADRWGTKKNFIFFDKMRGGRRCWTQMLGLPVRRNSDNDGGELIVLTVKQKTCELCEKNDIPLEGAHWVSAKNSGSTKRYNILNLCPNCHTLLDSGDSEMIDRGMETILYREIKKIIETDNVSGKKRLRLIKNICKAIISREPMEG